MALSEFEREVLNRRLIDAEQSYHALMTGKSARVMVDQNSERVEFTAANAPRLYAYIVSLKQQLGLLTSATSGLPSNGPATFTF